MVSEVYVKFMVQGLAYESPGRIPAEHSCIFRCEQLLTPTSTTFANEKLEHALSAFFILATDLKLKLLQVTSPFDRKVVSKF